MSIAFWTAVERYLTQGESVFVALVAQNSRFSPGTQGAKLCIIANGKTTGTIGGGIMEYDLIQRAQALLSNNKPDDFIPHYQKLIHRKNGDGDKSGLICAGNQTNVYAILSPDKDLPKIRFIVNCLQNDNAGIVRITNRGLEVSDASAGPAKSPIVLDISENKESAAGSENWVYEEQLLNWKRVAIMGGGHCGLALSRTLHQLGYVVSIFDTRSDVPTLRDNKFARHKYVVDDFADAGALISHPEFTHIVIMTANLDSDVRALLGVIRDTYPYIGLMGAPAKIARIKSALVEHSINPMFFEKVTAPIGLKMTSNTPEEIAISVAAQLLQLRESLFPHTRAK